MIDSDKTPTLSVIIPTYNRGSILIETIELLLRQNDPANEIIIVDQTQYDPTDPIFIKLTELSDEQKINWLKLDQPSIPVAMNKGLLLAKSEYVLFLDDDVTFTDNFIENHKIAIKQHNSIGHVGQIIQPWQTSIELENYHSDNGLERDLFFPFNSNRQKQIHNCMAGNLCVHRQSAIECGGFDLQFSGVAYRFETEFARRLIKTTDKALLFVPEASLNHLKVPSGGTRDYSQNHLTSLSSVHSEGDYYFALMQMKVFPTKFSVFIYIIKRLFGSICAKFYLKRPWWIPVRLIAEFKGLIVALKKVTEGPKYITESI